LLYLYMCTNFYFAQMFASDSFSFSFSFDGGARRWRLHCAAVGGSVFSKDAPDLLATNWMSICLLPRFQLPTAKWMWMWMWMWMLLISYACHKTSSALTYCPLHSQYWTCIIGRSAISVSIALFMHLFTQLIYRRDQLTLYIAVFVFLR